jgi:integrase
MRGTIHYQSAELSKLVFQPNAKKVDRIDESHNYFNKIASYETMATYRRVWNNLFRYLRINWEIKDCIQIEKHHIEAYLNYKIDGKYPSKKYIKKISTAIGRLEDTLNILQKRNLLLYDNKKQKVYNFSVRFEIVKRNEKAKLLADNYHNRAYKEPLDLINTFKDDKHKLAALIELEGGARVEACILIKKEQLLGIENDPITNTLKGKIFTKEKGGKVGEVFINIETYKELEAIIQSENIFQIDRQRYYTDIRNSCKLLKIRAEGSHGFRWNFAQRRVFEYAANGYYYQQALQAVSYEMKHNRAYITKHYLVA